MVKIGTGKALGERGKECHLEKSVTYVRATGTTIHKGKGLDVWMIRKEKSNRNKKMGSIKGI